MNRSDELPEVLSGHGSQTIKALAFEAPGGSNALDRADANPGPDPGKHETAANQAKFPGASLSAGNSARWWHSQFNLMLAVFGLLTVAAILFVLMAPPPEVNHGSMATAARVTSDSSTPGSQAPWSQGQLAQARSESQTILANLLASKKTLLQKDVLLWAPERYQQALDIAVQGDEYYKQQDYAGAISSYQSASDQMDSLFSLLPGIIDARLSEGEIAIREGKSELAKQKFEQVLLLDQSNVAAASGLDRAGKLDRVLQLIASANSDEADFAEGGDLEDLMAAEQKLLEAKVIDKLYQPIDQNLARVRSAVVYKRFKIAMTKGYQQLFANRYSAARKTFSQALKIMPGDSSAAMALQQSLASDKTASLSSLLAEAKTYEKQEEWASAQSNYQTVLQRDPNQVGAKLGNIRSGARSRFDLQIRDVLANTLSFGRSEQKSKASLVLADAQAISSKGPKLLQQISRLETALSQSDIAMKVSLQSDELTEVSLQKAGSKVIKLGKFSSRNLSLKPALYIVRGVRLGYQDVRTEIELYPGGKGVKSISVRCNQPIKQLAVESDS